jgi:tRNA pseudouridine55 synthase
MTDSVQGNPQKGMPCLRLYFLILRGSEMGSVKLGFINLNKPSGWTSHDCVAKLRKLLQIKRIGHGGTLDPAATGVLPIAVGKATRLLPYLPEKKAYQAKIRFGMLTTTDDLEGEVIHAQGASELTLEQIEAKISQFTGKITQIPPAYSAIQQGGKRLYELARQGKVVDVPSRTVEVHQIDVLGWYPGQFPELDLGITCGTGTYIRAIARDLGNILQVGGTLAQLTRTLSCGLLLEESLTLTEITTQLEQHRFELIQPALVLPHLPSLILSSELGKRWCQGQKIPQPALINSPLQIWDETGGFLGIGEFVTQEESYFLIPKLVLA